MVLLSSDELPPHLLTFAAEFAASVRSEKVHDALIKLLAHERAVVREGAVYGLNGHRSPEIMQALRDALEREQSPGVREAMSEALATLEEEPAESRAACRCGVRAARELVIARKAAGPSLDRLLAWYELPLRQAEESDESVRARLLAHLLR